VGPAPSIALGIARRRVRQFPGIAGDQRQSEIFPRENLRDRGARTGPVARDNSVFEPAIH
jgi:hypothetical protein